MVRAQAFRHYSYLGTSKAPIGGTTMNFELSVMLCVTRRLPRFVGSAHIVRMLSNLYVRKQRPRELLNVMGFHVELDPMELIDRLIMFAPQLYDYREVAYMRRNLSTGSIPGFGVQYWPLFTSRITDCGQERSCVGY